MNYISIFDPWKNPLCTCPKKYSLNPYTGCSFSCLYCYISSFIKNPFHVREKKDLIKNITKGVKKLDKNLYISMSNSSDPYPYIEEKLGITREILKIFRDEGIKVLIITKSDLVVRDLDILKDMNVSVSITTNRFDGVYKDIEKFAPNFERRVLALKKLKEANIKVSARIDPIIPFVNDDLKNIEEIIKILKNYVDQIIVSTLKFKPDSLKRFKEKFPDLVNKILPLYDEKIRGNLYLKKEIRKNLILKLSKLAFKYNLYFSSCREGFEELNSNICDGSGLIKK